MLGRAARSPRGWKFTLAKGMGRRPTVDHAAQQIRNSSSEKRKLQEELELMSGIKLKDYEPGGLGYHSIEALVEKEVTPAVANVLQRMNIAPRSFGSISPPAHVAGAVACNIMNMLLQRENKVDNLSGKYGPYQSCGEGGEHPSRYGTVAASLDHQVASGRWGAGLNYMARAKRLGIKVSQGVKPGQGGHLPGAKNKKIIAETRGTPEGIDLISPPPHHDIYSIEDLAALIRDLRVVNPEAIISVKLTARKGIGLVAAGAAKCGANDVKVTGYGATAAATAESKFNFATGVHYGIKEAHDVLTATGMRELVTLSASGRLQTPEEVVKAFLLGADQVSFGTGPMLALGCVKVDRCHDGTCPTGIATMDPERMSQFQGKPEHVARWMIQMAKEVEAIVATYGGSIDELIGRRDLLKVVPDGVYTNLEQMLEMPLAPTTGFPVEPKVDPVSYQELSAITQVRAGKRSVIVNNTQTDRTLGGRLAALSISDPNIKEALDEGVQMIGNGVGGSSLGFCAPAGLSIVVPRANHFVGKSLDGGEILVNGVAGDSLFYGGQAGFGFVRGAKHRFGVRSCCDLVAEMVGPMAACYRTGGHMMVLGSPACYDVSGNPLDVPSYSPPYRMPDPHSPASLDEIVGPGIGGGMTGGKLVLPTMLEERIRERDFFAEGANTMIQIPLSKDPAAEKWIVEALTRIETSLSAKSPAGKQLATQATTVDHSDPEVSVVAALLKLYRTDRAAFQKQFTVLDATKRTNPNEAVIAADFVAWNAETSQPVGPLIPLVTSAGPHANLEHSDDIAAVGSNVAPSDMPGRKKKKKRGAAAMNADGLGLKTAAEIADSPPGVFKDMMPTKDIGACGLYALAAKDNIATHHLVSDAIHALDCLAHRNGHTRDPKTHDGFGIAFHGGHSFWEKAFPEHTLAEDGYVVMPVFMPPTKPTQMGPMASVPEDAAGQYSRAKDRLNGILDNFGFSIAGTREVPIAYENLGMIAQEGMMPIEQFLIQCPEGTDFSRFCIDLERVAAQFDLASGFDGSFTHVPHVLSASPWVVYKGFTPPSDFASVFQDMSDPNFVTNAACGHGRFATNSEPTLQSVQPTRAFVHNGEVNNVALLDIAMADKHFLDYLGGNQTVELKLKKAGRAAMDLSDSYKCGLWHGYRRWAAAEDETAADLTLVKQMMGVVPAKNAQGGFGWRALTNIQEAFLETGPSARINMGMPGQPELIAAATDANHFRPLEALEDDKCVHFSSEYIDKVMPLNGTPWTFGGEGVLAMTKADMTLSEGVLPSLTDPETIALVKKLTPPPPVTKDSAPINRHSDEEIDTLKAVVGWSSDTEHMMDNMVGKGVLTLESMGYAAPTNPGMPGFRLDLGGLIKSSFAQVTSPPLAYHEEGKHYMSQLAVIGPHVLTSPVLSDAGVQSLISSTDMGVHTVDTTFAVNMHDLELEKEIRAVVDGACDLVRASVAASDGLNKPAHQMLLLSDLTLSRARGPLPQIFVASLLDKQLREAGLRKHTSLVCQSVTTLLPRDLAQLVAMGADAVHPVLPLDPRSTKHIEEGSLLPDQRTENVLATFRKGLNLFMASVGVSHFKAYQACRHLWYAEGLDANVAKMLGVDTIFTGIDFERLSRIVQVNHNFPREKGLEKYRPGAQKTFWPTWYVRAHIDAARGEDAPGQLQAANAKLAYLKRTEPDGELRLVKSRVWNAQNPFHILLVGAGPAAYELLKQLEARGIPCIPHLVEQRPISTGLVLGAISPLHDGTKQGVVRQYIQMLESGNIQFYGECAITKKNLANVAPMISAIVDCTGAMGSENSVPMYEDLAVPTSAMIRAYNRIGDSIIGEERVQNPNWPLSTKRNHPIIAGVGLGNAMADHVSMLLADRVFLEETDVNPRFLDVRDRVRPEGMRLFIRGPPHKLAADTKVLKELLGIMADSRVECIADFNSAVDKTLFSEEELELHELFEPLLNRSRISPTTAYDEDKEAGDEALLSARGLSAKRLFFHFGTTIDDVEVPLPNGNKRLSVTNHAGSKMSFRASDVITAMGFSAPETSWVADAIDDLVLDGEHKPVVMSCGWASGKGGNLGKVKESAKVVAEDIHRAVRAGRFDNGAAHYDQARLPLRGHLAQAEANALSYLLEGNRIHDRDTHAVAQQYSERVNMFEDEEDTGAVAAPAAAAAAPEAVPDGAIGITKSDGSSEILTDLGGADDMAHHLLMEKGFMAPVECDGDGVCLKCVCVVTGPAVEHDGEEKAILSANGLKPNAKDGSQHILACMHQASSLKGRQILAKFP